MRSRAANEAALGPVARRLDGSRRDDARRAGGPAGMLVIVRRAEARAGVCVGRALATIDRLSGGDAGSATKHHARGTRAAARHAVAGSRSAAGGVARGAGARAGPGGVVADASTRTQMVSGGTAARRTVTQPTGVRTIDRSIVRVGREGLQLRAAHHQQRHGQEGQAAQCRADHTVHLLHLSFAKRQVGHGE